MNIVTNMALHKGNGEQRYCAPTSMAAVLGISTDYAAKVLRQVSRSKQITGVYKKDLLLALKELNVNYTVISLFTTFNQVIKQKLITSTAIVLVTGHFIACNGKHWVDTGYLPVESFPRPRMRVRDIILINSHSVIEPKKEIIAKQAPKSFNDLISTYATAGLREEIELVATWIPDRLKEQYSIAEINAFEANGLIVSKYIAMNDEAINTKGNQHDIYLYLLFNEVMVDRLALEYEDIKAGNTIRMLNGKHKFATKI